MSECVVCDKVDGLIDGLCSDCMIDMMESAPPLSSTRLDLVRWAAGRARNCGHDQQPGAGERKSR